MNYRNTTNLAGGAGQQGFEEILIYCNMKDYFIGLFQYDRFASTTILKAFVEAGKPERSARIFAHLLTAQKLWLDRCKAITTGAVILWPEPQADRFAGDIEDQSEAWLELMEGLQPADFDKTISYANTKGEWTTIRLVDILTQVINHGTHHRAQIGQEVKLAGIDPPNTDYFSFVKYVKK
jgi:uncharacterized damage-inducible protein DinB